MAEEVRNCYDQLAANYHLVYADWDVSMARQSAALGPILEREYGVSQSLRILDCGCGIGTQALGLARRGHMITGCDLSPAAIGRAREEASNRALSIPLFVADMLDLTRIPENEFDAVVCLDNSLPHLESDEALLQAARQIRMKLRVDGTFIASVPDYDRDLAQEKPVIQGPSFYFDAGRRRIVHQVWDWIDDRRYTFHLYITREIPGGWESDHYASTYRAVLRGELTSILEAAGYKNVRWLPPAESGFYQPLVLAKAANAR